MLFPGADRSVAIWRNQTVTEADGYNHNVVLTAIATGVPIHLRDLNAVVDSTGAGRQTQQLYRGACDRSADIRSGDVLKDETENYPDGTPVRYEVVGATRNFAYLKTHLARTAFQ